MCFVLKHSFPKGGNFEELVFQSKQLDLFIKWGVLPRPLLRYLDPHSTH